MFRQKMQFQLPGLILYSLPDEIQSFVLSHYYQEIPIDLKFDAGHKRCIFVDKRSLA